MAKKNPKYYILVYKTKKAYEAKKPSFSSVKTLEWEKAEQLQDKNIEKGAYAVEIYDSARPKNRGDVSTAITLKYGTGGTVDSSTPQPGDAGVGGTMDSSLGKGGLLGRLFSKKQKEPAQAQPKEFRLEWTDEKGGMNPNNIALFPTLSSAESSKKNMESLGYTATITPIYEKGGAISKEAQDSLGGEWAKMQGFIGGDWTSSLTKEEKELVISASNRNGWAGIHIDESNMSGLNIEGFKKHLNKIYPNFSELGKVVADSVNDKINKYNAGKVNGAEK